MNEDTVKYFKRCRIFKLILNIYGRYKLRFKNKLYIDMSLIKNTRNFYEYEMKGGLLEINDYCRLYFLIRRRKFYRFL